MSVSKFKNIFFVLVFLFSIQSCSKFEDGPVISFRTKKQRLSQNWKIEYSINLKTGVRHSADYESWLLSFTKGGSYSKSIYYNNTPTTITGNWILSGNQLKLETTVGSEKIIEFYTITKLTKKELWVKDLLEEIHYYND